MTTDTATDYDLSWGEEEEPEKTAEVLAVVDTERDQNRQRVQASEVAKHVQAAVEAVRPGLDKIPDPVEPAGDGDLTDEEKLTLEKCEEGIDLLTTATWVAGKSLDTIATGRLFRTMPHKEEPERCYRTIEEWAWVEKGIRQSKCSKLRQGWEIGEVLLARGYDAPEGQVREIVPVKNAHGLKVAVGLYEMVAQQVGADKVTAGRLREVVKLLPGDLALKDDEDPTVIAQELKGKILGADQTEAPAALPATLPKVKQEADRAAVELANRLNRGRIPRNEVLLHLLAAFADKQDTTVFDAVFKRMKNTA